MSSCILLGRASQLVVSARDLWEGLQLSGQQEEAKEANIQVAVTPLSSYRPLAVCAGVSGAVVGASAACHPENNYQVPDEHCAEDPRLSASTEKEK